MARKKRGTALSADSIDSVRDALALTGWTQDTWARNANVSASTVGRLLRGIRVDADTLRSALKALNLEVSDLVIVKQDDSLAPTAFVPYSQQPGIYMTATFHQKVRPQIERCIRHLASLLVGVQVKYSESGDGVRVSGDFDEYQLKEIKMVLEDLEAWCITLHSTIDISGYSLVC